LKIVFAAGIFAGAVLFALVQLGAIGGDGDDDAAARVTPTPAVLGATSTPAPVATEVPSTEVPAPGTPVTGPIDVPIMMYHIIGPPDRPENDALAVSEADFAAQMSYLHCAGYAPITMARLFSAFDGTSALPEKPIVLTFDDGWAGQYTFGLPILQENGFVGSFAIATGFVDQGGQYVTWAQIEEMSQAGMEMMSHTANHIDLGTNDDATVIEQITSSKSEIEAHTGVPVEYFVYPAGEPFRSGTTQRQAEVVELLRDVGYKGALLANGVYGGLDPAAPYELNRVRVSGGEDVYTFAGSIYGPNSDSVSC
jgi:peptidoglycan/xylan/chitin deacetylase (PgdA/CDA1 family)